MPIATKTVNEPRILRVPYFESEPVRWVFPKKRSEPRTLISQTKQASQGFRPYPNVRDRVKVSECTEIRDRDMIADLIVNNDRFNPRTRNEVRQ